MPRNSLGALVLTCVAGVVYFTALPSGQGLTRQGRELVNGREVAAREALVRFREHARRPELADLRASDDVEALEQIGSVVRVRSRSTDAASLVDRMSRRPDVLYAEPNYVVRAFSIPSDASYPQLWGLENTGQVVGGAAGIAGADIRAVPAWDVSIGSTAHVIAVIDTGIDYTHPDLAANMWTAPVSFTVDLGEGSRITCPAGTHGFNAIARTCNPMDDQSHGTHVAGTIGATGNNGIGVVGVNWTTRLMAIKFLDAGGSGTIADAIAGIRFAVGVKRAFPGTGNVRVLSASWGGFEFSQALADEIAATEADDMLFVAAAGNYGLSNDSFPIYPASYRLANIVSVAATTNTDERAYFSNYGVQSVHLGAPGMDILSTIPGSGYAFKSGTSMAAPHVSGAAALVLSHCVLDTPGLKDTLLGSVQSTDALAAATVAGGRLDVHSAIHSCIAIPPAPSLIAIGGDGYIRLSWQGALGATAYTVRRGLTSGGPYAILASGIKGGRFVDSTLRNGTAYYYVVTASNPLGESPASNEASAIPNAPSDLVVSAITAPSAVSAGSPIAISVTTTNSGIGPAPETTTRIYLSGNGSLDASDVRLEPVHSVPQLDAGTSSTGTFSIVLPPDTPAGSRYLLAVADADRRAEEESESNNNRARAIAVGPDLTVSALQAPSTAGAGDRISVTDTVKNAGASAAGASSTSFYLSANASLDAGDTVLGTTRAVQALDPGATSTGTSSVTIPDGLGVGTYYLIARADGSDAVAESSESNNTQARSIRIGGDLTILGFDAPGKTGAGLTIALTEITKNQGTGDAAASTTRFYLSSNASLDAGDGAIGERQVPTLPAGTSSTATTSVAIPQGTSTGNYYLIAVADAGITVGETSESNNRAIRSIAIGPDLRVAAVSAPPSAAGGATIAVADTIENLGGGSSAGTVTRYYLSANAIIDTQDVLIGTRQASGLTAGAANAGTATVILPGDLIAATYYIIARADGNDEVAETQEGNNTSARPIIIGGDLRVSMLSAPAKGGAGLPLAVTDTTSNQGTASVAASLTRFYLSPNATLDPTDVMLPASRPVPALDSGASNSGSTTLVLPSGLTAGTYYVFAKADADGTVAETQEANNTAVRSVQIGADLTVSSLTVPAQAAVGSVVNVTDVTANNGGGEAALSRTRFHISTDTKVDGSDVMLDDGRLVPELAPGASSNATTSVSIPASLVPGTYYIIATADASGTVSETSDSNNARVQSIKVGPDLTVSGAYTASSTVQAGASVTVSLTVVNQGLGVAGASTARFYLSLNATFDASDVPVVGSRDIPALAGGASFSGTATVTIPAETADGTYYLLVLADADNAAAESIETNNGRIVRSIKVTLSLY